MSRALRQGSEYYKMRDGAAFPLRWSAPELLATDGSRCTSASDVWSFFVLMWEVWSRAQVPFGAKSGILVSMILEDVREGIILPGTILDKPAHADSALYQGLQDLCWVVSPGDRASFAQICTWIGDRHLERTQPASTLILHPTDQGSEPYQTRLVPGARPYAAAAGLADTASGTPHLTPYHQTPLTPRGQNRTYAESQSTNPSSNGPPVSMDEVAAVLIPTAGGSDDVQERADDREPALGSDEVYLKMLRNVAGGCEVFADLEQLGVLHVTQEAGPPTCRNGVSSGTELYTSVAYTRLLLTGEDVSRQESDIVQGKSTIAVNDTLKMAMAALSLHSSAYDGASAKWFQEGWPRGLAAVHGTVMSALSTSDPVLQPNPWRDSDSILSSSKRYLSRILKVFATSDPGTPLGDVAAACARLAADFGDGVQVLVGPPKKEKRVMEKARDSGYACIRDYARLSLIISDGTTVPGLVQRLADCRDFELVRAKNRLDFNYDAKESGGYRDYQALVRVGPGGWIVEVQVIPADMYALKSSLGHAGYAKYRFVLEACKRANAREHAPAATPAQGSSIVTIASNMLSP